MFTDLVDMIDHKKYYCKLRFTCKCDMTQDGVDCINGAQCGGGGGFGEGKETTNGATSDARCSLCTRATAYKQNYIEWHSQSTARNLDFYM